MNCGEKGVLVGGIAGKGQGEYARKERSFAYLNTTAKSPDLLRLHVKRIFPVSARQGRSPVCGRQVIRRYAPEHGIIIFLCLLKCLSGSRCLLLRRKVKRSVGFRRQGLSPIGAVDIPEQHRHGAAVGYDMVHFDKEVPLRSKAYQSEAEQRRLREGKAGLLGRQSGDGFFRKLCRHIRPWVHGCIAAFIGVDAAEHGGMGAHSVPNCPRQSRLVDFLRQLQQHGYAVSLHAGAQTVEIYPRLCFRQRIALPQRAGRFLRLAADVFQQGRHYPVFHAQDAAAGKDFLGGDGQTVLFVKLHGKADGCDGGHSHIGKLRLYVKVTVAYNLPKDRAELFLQLCQAAAVIGLRGGSYDGWESALIHLHIRSKRYLLDLHGGGGHHIGRLALTDKAMQRHDVHRFVRHHIGVDAFPSRRIITSNNCGIPDVGICPDNALHLRKLNAEAADLHLHVPAADKLDIAVIQKTDDVAGSVTACVAAAGVFLIGIGHKCLFRLLGAVKVAFSHLRSGDHQLARSSHRNTPAKAIRYI